jgi:hypothetical protein
MVPRGTAVVFKTGRQVWPLRLSEFSRAALVAGEKTTHRFVVNARNSVVTPGSFLGLDLDSGRRRVLPDMAGTVELRARHAFASGDTRAVSVRPIYQPGDVFWIRPANGGGVEGSTHCARVIDVDVARLQDITEAAAIAEGFDDVADKISVTYLNGKRPPLATARGKFERAWNNTRTQAWRSNPWVWVVQLTCEAGNVRDLYADDL